MFPFLIILSGFCAYAILTYPFPANLLLLYLPFVLLITYYDMRWGIGLWYITSTVGNFLEIDLPGIPPLRPCHIGLLLLLTVWFVKSHKEIPSAIGRFLSTSKNRILLVLLGWITFSMVMGRISSVTQETYEYQFNAWLSVVLVILAALLLSNHLDERFLRTMIWIIVCLQTVLYAATFVIGIHRGIELFGGWRMYVQEFNSTVGLVKYPPLFLALLFFLDQKGVGRVLFSAAIVVSLVDTLLLILSGHRSSALYLVSTLGFIMLFTKPRLLLVLVPVVLLPLVVLNVSAIHSWISEQVEYTNTHGLAYGKGTRIALAIDAIQIALKYPLWGTGSDRYQMHTNVLFVGADHVSAPAPTVHNSWLQAAVDHGIPAAVLLVVFCGYVFKDAFLLFRSLNNQLFKSFALFFLAAFGERIMGSFISSGQVLPVFTGETSGESAILASILFSFWLSYGLLLGIENKQVRNNSAVVNYGAGQ